MPKITEYKKLSLDDLVIGKGQVRTSEVGRDIEELADSIRVQGLLQPIVVCKSEEKPEKWEILTGKRRFLAHKHLRKESITAAILDGHVDEGIAKAISITENLIRRKLSGKELIDGVTYLYKFYGSQKDVVEATGLPARAVRDYVKYPRLISPLKKLVDDGTIDIHGALKAQDASVGYGGEPDPDTAVKLAKEMVPMSGVQRKKIVQERKKDPDKSIDDIIEAVKGPSKVTQVSVTITQKTHRALQKFANNEGINQDEAAATLLERALESEGLLDE